MSRVVISTSPYALRAVCNHLPLSSDTIHIHIQLLNLFNGIPPIYYRLFYSNATVNAMQIWCLLRQFRQGDVRLRASDPWTAAEGWTNNVTMRLASNANSDWDILGLQLVGGIPTHLKNMKVSWDDDIPN